MGTDFLDVLEARNISVGGMKIIVPHLFKGCDINSPVDVIIKLPQRKSFKARGLIKHIHGNQKSDGSFGFKFTEISESDREAVDRYVQKRLLEGGEA